MTAPTWPAELPQYCLRTSLAGEGADNVIRSQPAIGPAKTRRRTVANIEKASGAFVMSEEQFEAFEAFFLDDIACGAKAFFLPDQRGRETPQLIRIVPPYKYSRHGATAYRVELNWDVLP